MLQLQRPIQDSRSFPAFYHMNLGNCTNVTQKTGALSELITIQTLANVLLVSGLNWAVLSHVRRGRGQKETT